VTHTSEVDIFEKLLFKFFIPRANIALFTTPFVSTGTSSPFIVVFAGDFVIFDGHTICPALFANLLMSILRSQRGLELSDSFRLLTRTSISVRIVGVRDIVQSTGNVSVVVHDGSHSQLYVGIRDEVKKERTRLRVRRGNRRRKGTKVKATKQQTRMAIAPASGRTGYAPSS
jgi:hypothetical protein